MRWQDVPRRITGISCPIFGVAWHPPESHREVVNRVLANLGGRRVLFWDAILEYPKQCEESILKIRDELSNEIGKLEPATHLRVQFEAMRTACLAFLKRSAVNRLIVERLGEYEYEAKHWEFVQSLSFLRRDFGHRIAILSAGYGIDVGPDLSSIIPSEEGL